MKKKRVLIVHPDQNMLDEIGELLSDFSDDSDEYTLVCWRGRTVADAVEIARKGAIDLLITALDIAADDASPIGAGEHGRRGLELVRTLRGEAPKLHAVVVTGREIDVSSEVKLPEGVQWVYEGKSFDKELKVAVDHLLGSHPGGAPRQVELWISLSKYNGCGYQFQPDGGKALPWRPIDMEPGRLESFVVQSRLVHVKESTFETELKVLGESFADELLKSTPKNIKLSEDLKFWEGKVGIDNIRVRFSVDDDLNALAVEATKRRDEKLYWLDRTAIYRGLDANLDGSVLEPRGLFQDEETRSGPINVLIIQADVPVRTIVKDGKLELCFDPLPSITDEVKAITTLLAKVKGEGQAIGEVRVISAAKLSLDESFSDVVENALEKTKWHIVHYAGHTHYDAGEHVGYLFFPRADPIRLEPVRIDLFAWMLRKADTRFVFLSSCQSAGQDFIYHLARERIPAIMGFLWVVKDERAVDYAKSFYKNLFTGGRRTLENACFEAKKEMHVRFPLDPIWASPVLVMQFGG